VPCSTGATSDAATAIRPTRPANGCNPLPDPASAIFGDRKFARVDFEYALYCDAGRVTPKNQSRAWFFQVPVARENEQDWLELINRLIYDANVRLGRSEPADRNWLNLVSLAASPFNMAAVLALDGSSFDEVLWFESERTSVWEGRRATTWTTPGSTTCSALATSRSWSCSGCSGPAGSKGQRPSPSSTGCRPCSESPPAATTTATTGTPASPT
jgi:hypothetical protein